MDALDGYNEIVCKMAIISSSFKRKKRFTRFQRFIIPVQYCYELISVIKLAVSIVCTLPSVHGRERGVKRLSACTLWISNVPLAAAVTLCDQ